jgi:hypothetical protein
MSDQPSLLTVGLYESLPEVLNRLRPYAGTSVIVEVPPACSVLLTANEYRAVQAMVVRDKLALTIATDDPLRRQLAAMFKLPLIEVAKIPRPEPALSENGTPPEPISLNERRKQKYGEQPSTEPLDNDQTDVAEAEKPKKPFPIRALLAGIGAFVAIAAVAYIGGYFLLTKATIAITAKRQPVSAELTVAFTSDGQKVPDDVDLSIAGTSVTLPVSADKTVQVTGVVTVGDQSAKGAMSFSNTTETAVTLTAGTQIVDKLTDAVFQLDADIQIPARNGETPGFANGTVTALQPGAASNRGLGALSGHLQEGVYFSNRESAIQGGTDRQITAVSQEDIDAVEQQVREAMIAAVTAPNGQSILPGSIELTNLSFLPSHKVGDETTSLTINGTATATAIAYDTASLQSAIASSGKLPVPDGYELVPSTLGIAEPQRVDSAASDSRYVLAVQGEAAAAISPEERDAIREQAAGSRDSDLKSYLATISQIDSYEFSYSPGWLPQRMPASSGKITVEVK